MCRLGLALPSLLLVALAAVAQPPLAGSSREDPAARPPPQATPVPSLPSAATSAPYTYGEVYSVEVVLVPVAVRGENPAERLGKDRFTLRVDGRRVPVESFESDAKAPLSLVFLQDLSGSMAEPGKLETSREILNFFLQTAHGADELALATFAGGRTTVDVPLTSELAALREAISLWEPYGITGLYDAVAMLPEISLGSSVAKRAAVLITDGVDNASEITPAQAEALVQQAELPVYVLALPAHEEPPASSPYRYADLLRRLAETTGGRYYDLSDPAQARRTCASILGELRHQYVLGFSVTGAGPSRYHALHVELRGGGRRVSVVHRRGYRGTAPAATEPG